MVLGFIRNTTAPNNMDQRSLVRNRCFEAELQHLEISQILKDEILSVFAEVKRGSSIAKSIKNTIGLVWWCYPLPQLETMHGSKQSDIERDFLRRKNESAVLLQIARSSNDFER